MKVVSVINYKGGVGKTTITANLASEMVCRRKRVLVIDLDPQTNLTFSYMKVENWRKTYEKSQTIKYWFDSIIDGTKPVPSFSELIVKGKGVDLICSHLGLIDVDIELAAGLSAGTERQHRNNFVKTYSPLTSDEIVAKEKSNMDEKRFKHCIGVSETSRKLAELNNYDPDKAALAGFIHDYAKQVSPARFIEVIKEQHFDPDLLNYNRAIWHGIVGSYFIEKELKITDPEILTAIKRHTTADVEMTTLDKIVFVADFIEPGRDFPGVEEARKVAFANLDDGVGFELAHTLDFLITNRKKIYPKTFAAYNKWAVKD